MPIASPARRGPAGRSAATPRPRRRTGVRDNRPDIVFILADDLGFADLACYGRDDYATPNLDRLARQGVLLTNAYSNSSVCSPTRLALMTGRYQYRWPGGLDEPIGRDPSLGLPPEVPTLPSLLRDDGYRTSLVGKWHLGELPQFGPLKSGYERFFGLYAGGADYFLHGMTIRGKFRHDLYEGETEVFRHGYLTDLITERAIAEIDHLGNGDAPYLLSVHYTAPHWPWEGVEDEEKAARIRDSFHYDGGSNPTYASMMKSLDDGVGALMEALRARGRARDTVVVFTSDNGGERFSKVWPFRGMKGELLEGGIRVPAIVRWPARLAARSTNDQVTMTMDWVPTLLAAAGSAGRPSAGFDGVDILDVLEGRAAQRERLLFWRHKAQDQRAALGGRMKYLQMSGHEFLFDIGVDPLERANLKTVHPERFQQLKSAFESWNLGMLPYRESTFSYELRGNGSLAGY